MNKLIYLALFLSVTRMSATDTLKIEKPKTFSIKTNLAVLLMRGFSLQAEYILNKRTGLWIETTHHVEEHSFYNTPLKETNFIAGINRYKLSKNSEGARTHCGTYFGPYLKYKNGYYCGDKELNYSSLFLGIQAGIQTVFRENILFNMGMGYGAGYFLKRQELSYSTFFDKYNLPIMDFRATVSLGYMF
jgi:hypothetical protein